MDEGKAARRSGGGVLSGSVAGGKAARRSGGAVLSKATVEGKAARRSGRGVFSKEVAGGEAARQSGGGVSSKAVAGRKATRRSSGGVLSKAVAGGKAARRSGGGVLSKAVAGGITASRGCSSFKQQYIVVLAVNLCYYERKYFSTPPDSTVSISCDLGFPTVCISHLSWHARIRSRASSRRGEAPLVHMICIRVLLYQY